MSTEESVFISWSGDRSKGVAEKLRDWLPCIISARYWVSSRDLPDGKRWVSELSRRLEDSHFGIIVVTPENRSSPWLLFEAGALSKNIKEGRVVPYLVSLEKGALEGPLKQFQALAANKNNTLRLVESIRLVLPNSEEKEVIKKRFNLFWPEFEFELTKVLEQPPPNSSTTNSPRKEPDDVAGLRDELAEIGILIRQLVKSFPSATTTCHKPTDKRANKDLVLLEGPWWGHGTNSHLYIKVIDGKIVAPYCYMNNHELTGEYYDWKKIGDYWFARYKWFKNNIHGFSFYKLERPGKLAGMWWYDHDMPIEVSTFEEIDDKTRSRGHYLVWTKEPTRHTPKWAQDFFQKTEEGTLRKKKA